MPGLVPGIHVFLSGTYEDVDGLDRPGHDVFLDSSCHASDTDAITSSDFPTLTTGTLRGS